MNKQRARDILKVHACCSFTTKENKLCMLCPWNNTGDCIDTRINEELIIEAMNTLKGIKPMETVKLSEIKITKVFKNTTPNSEKMQKCREYYEENKKQERPILLDYKNILRDGYIQYLILKENGVEEATIMRKKRNKKTETTYIFGVHPNSKCQREFVWRVPVEWNDWADNLGIGDIIMCRTKFGVSPVIVNRIETLDKPPIDIEIKRVFSRKVVCNE